MSEGKNINPLKPEYTMPKAPPPPPPAPDALHLEVERLKNALEVEKRSLQCEVNRRNQYAMESDELDRQVEALKADAERYRHIRENADTMHWENMLKTDIDAAIDAASIAEPEVKK